MKTKKQFALTSLLFMLGSFFMYPQLAPKDGKKLLFIGQDLKSVKDYRSKCKGCHPGHGETTYISFYILKEPYIDTPDGGIFYGAMGMDNEGNPIKDNTNWGAGPLNLWKAAKRSTLINIGMSLATDYAPEGLEKIGRGDHDDIIEKMAIFFNQFPDKVFYLRIGYEFDGNWNTGYNVANNYIAAYRRIVDILNLNLKQENVNYVWQASASPVDDAIEEGKRENLMDWYPGHKYVDWTGISWFLRYNEKLIVNRNKFSVPNQLQLAREMLYFSDILGKPMMIAEAAPQGYDLSKSTNCNIGTIWDGDPNEGCQNKEVSDIYAEWFEPFFNFVSFNDEIKAVAYINANWDAQTIWGPPYNSGYWGDTRIESNVEVRKQWIRDISKNGFLKTKNPSKILDEIGYENQNKLVDNQIGNKLEDQVTLYPNPTKNLVHLDNMEPNTPYIISNMAGKHILQGTLKTKSIDTKHIPKGIYMIKIGERTIKFIKK